MKKKSYKEANTIKVSIQVVNSSSESTNSNRLIPKSINTRKKYNRETHNKSLFNQFVAIFNLIGTFFGMNCFTNISITYPLILAICIIIIYLLISIFRKKH